MCRCYVGTHDSGEKTGVGVSWLRNAPRGSTNAGDILRGWSHAAYFIKEKISLCSFSLLFILTVSGNWVFVCPCLTGARRRANFVFRQINTLCEQANTIRHPLTPSVLTSPTKATSRFSFPIKLLKPWQRFTDINLLKTKRNLLYIRNQSVPRTKLFPPPL